MATDTAPTTDRSGLAWCAAFVILDALGAVYFGTLLQRMDSLLVGTIVLGITAVFCLGWTWLRDPRQLTSALRASGDVIGINVSVALAWVGYLFSLQLIEPAVAFTIFSGAIPLAALVAGKLGFGHAPSLRNLVETVGYAVLALGLAILVIASLAGWSGFVRGGAAVAVSGLGFAVLAGVMAALMLIYGGRLHRAGVGPLAQTGLRFPLYVLVAFVAYLIGWDDKGPAASGDLLLAIVAGIALLSFPIYAVQQAVSRTPTLTIGALVSVGPLLVFLLQAIEGRVDYAPATLAGLLIYFAGALLAAFGSVWERPPPKGFDAAGAPRP